MQFLCQVMWDPDNKVLKQIVDDVNKQFQTILCSALLCNLLQDYALFMEADSIFLRNQDLIFICDNKKKQKDFKDSTIKNLFVPVINSFHDAAILLCCVCSPCVWIDVLARHFWLNNTTWWSTFPVPVSWLPQSCLQLYRENRPENAREFFTREVPRLCVISMWYKYRKK